MASDSLRRRSAPGADGLDRLLDAAAEQVREAGWAGLTVRLVAQRAGVSAATAYNYVSSKEHLLTALFHRELTALPRPAGGGGPQKRIARLVGGIAALVAADPALIAAYRAALLADDADARRVRGAIEEHLTGEFAWALEGLPAEVQESAGLAFVGAMVMAGAGNLPFDAVAERVARVVRA